MRKEKEGKGLTTEQDRPQEVGQTVGTTPNKAEVTSANPPPPLMWTYQKKKKGTRSSKFQMN
jgi:hypothetical protein